MKTRKLIFSISLIFAALIAGAITNSVLKTVGKSGQDKYANEKNGIPDGHLPLSHFYFEDFAHLQIWSVAQDSSGLMLFATPRGLITYDGKEEAFLKIPQIPYIIKRSPYNKKLYLACEEGFGTLQKKTDGNYKYIPLNDSLDDFRYTDILFYDNKTAFLGQEKVSLLDTKDKIIFKREAKEEIFESWLLVDETLILKQKNRFFKLEYPAEKLPVLNEHFRDKNIRSFVTHGDSLIVCFKDNSFYKIHKETQKTFEPDAQKFLNESLVTGISDINDKLFAVSTLNGGVLIMNKISGKTVYTINYRTGLPDDEIFAVGNDDFGGVWISHAYGISRADLDLPVRDYSNYPGIEGKINALQIADTSLYAATGEGLFFLSEVEGIEEIQVLVKRSEEQKRRRSRNPQTDKPVREPDNTNTNTNDKQNNESASETESGKVDEDVGLIERWRNKWKKRRERKKREDDKEENTTNNETENTETDDSNSDENTENDIETESDNPPDNSYEPSEPTYIEKEVPKSDFRKEYELQSVKYAFKPVEGLSSKCKQVLNTKFGLFAAAIDGFYKVSDKKAENLLKTQINYIAEGDKKIFIAAQNGLFSYSPASGIDSLIVSGRNKLNAHSVTYAGGKVWIGAQNEAYSFQANETENFELKKYEIETEFPEKLTVKQIEGIIYFFTTDAVYEYNPVADSLQISPAYKDFGGFQNYFIFPAKNALLVKNKSGIIKTTGAEDYQSRLRYMQLNPNIQLSYFFKDEIWNVTNSNELLKITDFDNPPQKELRLQVEKITIDDSTSIEFNTNKTVNLPYDYGKLNIKMSAPSYIKQNSVKFYYAIDDKAFIETDDNMLNLPAFSYGMHTVKIYAENLLKEKSETIHLKMKVKTPFWYSIAFWILVVILGIAIGIAIAVFTNRQKNLRIKRRNQELEAEVQRRTQKIREQNEEIKKQNEAIIDQNEKIALQNKHISQQHEEITDSIKYASRIQTAVLPAEDILNKYLNQHFIYYNPRDIVSGDFYWFHTIENELFIAAADCTGHGVPGAFLSMLGISFLNEIVTERNIAAGEILDKLRAKVIKSLHQDKDSFAKDGMDISLVKINTDTLVMEFAGANNLIFHIRGDELTNVKPDRMPVSYHRRHTRSFKTVEIQLERNDLIYMFSDGYIDQFGQVTKRKFSKGRLRELIMEIKHMDMAQQKEIVEAMLLKWKGNHIQVDDILLVGLKI